MKLLTIVGARPQFVKAATISRALIDFEGITEDIVHTGQHFDANMSDVFFEEMAIPKPKHHLGISGGGHGDMTGQMLKGIEEILLSNKPDVVLVYGDTNSTLAGALAAVKLHIPVAHVEAGLRSFNMKMPEEINRILTDRVSKILLCPTDTAVQNLKKEGYDHIDAKVIRTGDVMLDAAMFYSENSKPKAKTFLELKPENFVLSTIHRAENTDSETRLTSIFDSLKEISQSRQVVLPLHPRTKKYVAELGIDTSGITITDPVGYFDMLEFLKNCEMVMTDSGGLQKEAYFFDKPCITLRDETEWTELVDAGHNRVVGASKEKVLDAFNTSRNIKPSWERGLYGDGRAAHSILNHLQNEL